MDLSPQYLHLLAGLQPFFAVAADAAPAQFNARDNAAGAVARIILKNTAAVPLDRVCFFCAAPRLSSELTLIFALQVLPVLLSALPLRNDYLENRAVFNCIFHLFRSEPSSITQHIDQLLPVFAHVLDPSAPDQLSDEGRVELIALINALNVQVPDKVRASGLQAFCS